MLYSINRFKNLDASFVEASYNNAPDVSEGPVNEAPDVTTGPDDNNFEAFEESSYIDSLLEALA